MHRKALGSRRHPALNGLGVNEGEALEERKLAPIRSPAQRSEFPPTLYCSWLQVTQRSREDRQRLHVSLGLTPVPHAAC